MLNNDGNVLAQTWQIIVMKLNENRYGLNKTWSNVWSKLIDIRPSLYKVSFMLIVSFKF